MNNGRSETNMGRSKTDYGVEQKQTMPCRSDCCHSHMETLAPRKAFFRDLGTLSTTIS